jgi:hypothetical protein
MRAKTVLKDINNRTGLLKVYTPVEERRPYPDRDSRQSSGLGLGQREVKEARRTHDSGLIVRIQSLKGGGSSTLVPYCSGPE